MEPEVNSYQAPDPLATFRELGESAVSALQALQRATDDQRVSALPTSSHSRKAMRRWMSNIDHLENYFVWQMHEHKNQARFHSPESYHPARMKMIFRAGKKLGDHQIGVRSIGAMTVELFSEKLQPGLFDMEVEPNLGPVEMLALVAECKKKAFGEGASESVTCYVAHVTGLNLGKSILECSEILTIGSWDVNQGPGTVTDLPPSRPIVPIIVARDVARHEGG